MQALREGSSLAWKGGGDARDPVAGAAACVEEGSARKLTDPKGAMGRPIDSRCYTVSSLARGRAHAPQMPRRVSRDRPWLQ